MSAPTSKEAILFEQRILACGGFYKGKLDGLWGPKSEAAAKAAEQIYLSIRERVGEVDARSEKNIATLLPSMQEKARKIIQAAYEWSGRRSFTFSILSGTRSYSEQDALFSERPKVTNARGGQSNHNFGIAVDLGIFDIKGKYLTGDTRTEEKTYEEAIAAIRLAVPGVEFGADWKSFRDLPHIQHRTGLTTAQTRARFEAGDLRLV